MSVIFQKSSPPFGNCLVLGIREAFYQPFNIGTWTEARMGMYYSFTAAPGSSNPDTFNVNSPYVGESMAYTGSPNGLFIGITNSGATTLPLAGNSIYAGISLSASFVSGSGILADGILKGFPNGSPNLTTLCSSGTGYQILGSFGGLYPVSPALSTGTSSYASFLGLRFVIGNVGQTGQTIDVSASTNQSGIGTNSISLDSLRAQLLSFPNQSIGTPQYFTTGFSSGGGPLPPPDSMLIYFPLDNNRIRIHNLAIERYQPLT